MSGFFQKLCAAKDLASSHITRPLSRTYLLAHGVTERADPNAE
jgi:hypothetical protein